MLRDSLIILRKELKRLFTDRRMVFFLVVLPLIMLPVMYSIMAKMEQAKRSDIASYTSTICLYQGVGNESVSPRFLDALSEMNAAVLLVDEAQLDSIRQSITDKDKELLIVLPDHIQESLSDWRTFNIGLYYNSTGDYSQYTFREAQEALGELSAQIIRERVRDSGISDEILTVFTVNQDPQLYDLAEAGSLIGKVISLLLPFFIIIYLFANSMKVGLDSVAGEKERGTLAVLLVNQVSRLSIVIGKMLAVMVAAIVGAASSVIGLIIGSRYFISMFGAAGSALKSYSLSTMGILQFAIVAVPLAILVSSIVLIISTYARNTKEGQGMIMPVYFVVMIMGVATMQTGDVPPGWMQKTPIFNSLLTLKGVFMNEAAWSEILAASLSSVVLSVILIYLTLRMFSSEKILFRI
jgi:sodium transport system permease protein